MGTTTIEILVILATVAIIACAIIPKFNDAFLKRSEEVTNNFKSVDTIIIE